MTIKEFRKGCDDLYEGYDTDMITHMHCLVKYCRSVFEECKRTMNNSDLAEMLLEYSKNLYCVEGAREELKEVLTLREEVCHRLADKSFLAYGAQWADAILTIAYGTEDFMLYAKGIGIYEKLRREYHNSDVEEPLADCYSHLLTVCDYKERYREAIEYGDKAAELYERMYARGEESLMNLGFVFSRLGDMYMALSDYAQAEVYYEKAA